LDEYGFRRATAEPGVVYKVLRALEDNGAIRSTWATRESGPARRYYEITEDGQELLRHRMHQLHRYFTRVQRLLNEYSVLTGEDVTSSPGGEPGEQRELALAAVPEPGR